MKYCIHLLVIVVSMLWITDFAAAQPGSIITQNKTVLIDDDPVMVTDIDVVTKTNANKLLNKLVGMWKFEYALSEELGGFAAGTPVIATVNYR